MNFQSTLEDCYENCSNNTEALMNVNLSHVPTKSGSEFDLYCRDSRKLVIKVNHQPKNEETSIFMLVVQESTGKFIDRLVYYVSMGAKNIQMKFQKITIKSLGKKLLKFIMEFF